MNNDWETIITVYAKEAVSKWKKKYTGFKDNESSNSLKRVLKEKVETKIKQKTNHSRFKLRYILVEWILNKKNKFSCWGERKEKHEDSLGFFLLTNFSQSGKVVPNKFL